MSNEIVKAECPYAAFIQNFEKIIKICEALMRTKHYQHLGEAGVFAIVQKAYALGIDPIGAVNGDLYYMQGKVGMSSEMMASLIRQRGHSITKDPKSDASQCTLYGRRADNGDTWQVSFSMSDAERAGLARNMYHKYPANMVYNRAMSTLARQLFPDVIKGAGYTHEELKEIASTKVSNVHEIVADPEPLPVEIISSEQAEELISIVDDCDEAYKMQLMEFIGRPPIAIKSLSDLPSHLYERVMKAALKKRAEAYVKRAGDQEKLVEVQEENES